MANEATVDQQQLQRTIDELYQKLSELFPAQRDALRNALNTIQVGESQALGMLAAADDLATAPIGDGNALAQNLMPFFGALAAADDLASSPVGNLPVLLEKLKLTPVVDSAVNGTLYATNFGVTGDGSDQADAVQAVWEAADQQGATVIQLPAGDIVLEKSVTGKPVLFIGRGRGTRIILRGDEAHDGFVFQSSDVVGRQGGAIGMQVVASGANMGRAFTTPKDSSQYFNYFTSWHFAELFFRGQHRTPEKHGFAWDYGFEYGVHVGDGVGVDIVNYVHQGQFDIQQDPAAQFHDGGILLDASQGGSAIMTARLSNIEIGQIYESITIGDNAFFSLTTFDLISTYNGVGITGTTRFTEPKIWGGNINCQNTGIHMKGTDARGVHDVTIRRHKNGWPEASNEWNAVIVDDCAVCSVGQITAQPDFSVTMFAGLHNMVKVLNGSGAITLHNNMPGNALTNVYNLSNASGVTITGDVLAGSGGTYIRATENTRNVQASMPSQANGSASYTMVSRDSTIKIGAIVFDGEVNKRVANQPDTLHIEQNANVDGKIWRQVVGNGSNNRQVCSDDRSINVNYELVTRSATSVTKIEWRAGDIFLNSAAVRTPSGTVSTSDARLKGDWTADLSAELRAWSRVQYGKYRLKSNYGKLRIGVLAQQVIECFRAEGLDAMDYGIVNIDPDGYYGVCYEEALCLEAALTRMELLSLAH